MSRFELTGDQEVVRLESGFSLKAPGIAGSVEFDAVGSARRRRRGGAGAGAAADVPQPIDDALHRLEMQEVATAVIEVAPDAPLRRRRGSVGPVETIDLETPAPPPQHDQVVMMVEENGVITWHVEEKVAGSLRRARGASRIYRIPVRPPSAPAGRSSRRGLFSAIGRKILKVLVFPVTDLIVGPGARFIALKWEQRHAPYGLRTFTPANFTTKDVPPLTPDDWKRLGGGPALLFVHGTFSNAHGAFSRFEPEALASLVERYQGRVFAFNHPTLSHDPKTNVEWLYGQIPTEVRLALDVVCHSRGGLVSRVLATAGDELGGEARVHVKRIVFVASPNEGTALTHPDHIVKMLDRYTNIVQFLPDGPIEVVIEGVLTAVKIVAHAGLKYLPGLAAMAPRGEFLRWLRGKQVDDLEQYALAADFEPPVGGLKELIKQSIADRVIDGVFQEEKNDLVVPTRGVGELVDGPGFPIQADRRFTFASDSGISHTNFFGHAKTAERLMEWLAPRA